MQELYQMFGPSNKKEKDGIDVVLSVEPLLSFKVARAGGENKKYSETLAKMLVPYKRQLDMGTLSESVSRKIMIEVFCRTCLQGWEGVTTKTGELIPYSEAAAIERMESLPDLYMYLLGEAQKFANYREDAEELAKN